MDWNGAGVKACSLVAGPLCPRSPFPISLFSLLFVSLSRFLELRGSALSSPLLSCTLVFLFLSAHGYGAVRDGMGRYGTVQAVRDGTGRHGSGKAGGWFFKGLRRVVSSHV